MEGTRSGLKLAEVKNAAPLSKVESKKVTCSCRKTYIAHAEEKQILCTCGKTIDLK